MSTKRMAELTALGLTLLLLVLAVYGVGNSSASAPSATAPERPPEAQVTVVSRMVISCNEISCNGADPDYAQCAYDLHHIGRKTTVDVRDEHGFAIAELQIVGASHGRCGSVQWAKIDKLVGIRTFALRLVSCDGIATTWRMPSDYSEPAWSDMLGSPTHCAWAEYGVRDSHNPTGWRAVAWVKAQ